MKNLFLKTIAIALFLLAIPAKQYGQQPRSIKVSEVNISSLNTIEERTFLIHSIQDHGYLCQRNYDKPNTIDIYMSSDLWEESEDFDALLAELYDSCVDFSYLDKSERGELYVQWRQDLDDEVNFALYESFTKGIATDNATCETAAPFCTDNGAYTFPAGVNSGSPCGSQTNATCSAPYKCSGTPGQSTNCLSTAPNPAFYYMKIATAGNLNIKIYSQPRNDIDFDCWGPFDNIETACSQLSCNNIVDCSYKGGTDDEFCHINNAQQGKYYILLLTNYSNSACNIHFENVGSGTTDCNILPPLVENGGPYCVSETITLSGNAQSGASYSWSGPGGWTATGSNVTRPNCNLSMAGTYTCTISLNGQTNSAETEVSVYAKPTANFTSTSVCVGNSTQFTSTSTTNPANQTMSYHWDFGGGQTSNQQNPSFQFSSAGTHPVTLTVSCGNGTCTSSKTQNVTVYPNPVANAGEDQTVYYGDPATLSGSGGSGTFNYHWEPADKVVNPNAQTTQTVGLQQSTTFTLTVTHPQGGCSSTDQVSVLVQGSHMTATASASPTSICLDETSQLHATGIGGTGNYTYAWTPTIGLSSPNIANPVAHPTETTTYSCLVDDGQSSQTVSTTVTVNYPEYEEVEQWICPDDSYTFYGQEYTDEDNYDYVTTTAQGCEKIITLHLHHYQDYPNAHTTTEYICPGTSVQFYGHYYSNPGRYPKTFETINGCDSIVWLDLNVYPANDTIDVEGSTCIGKPYLYHGVEYTENTDMYFDTIDENGCLLVEHFRLTVGEYQTPPNYEPNKFICYDYGEEPEYYWDIAGRTYHENAIDSIILPGPAGECDYKYMLNLKFHSRFFNEIDTTVCNMFEWEVDHNTYNTSQRLYKNFQIAGGSQFKCDSIYIVNLTVNHDKDTTFNVSSCNQYVWQFSNAGTDTIIKHPGTYTKTILTHQGCDSIGTLNLQLDYSPTFDLVEGHSWVVGGSEFQFTVEDYWINTQGSHITSWELRDKDDNPFTRWDLLPYGDNFDRCLVYIYTYELDTIYIHATTRSTGQGNEFCGDQPFSMRKMIICSSYGTPEITQHCSADIYPNPNDGNMTLSFTNMPGDIVVKVFNIQGAQIDQFQVHNGYESSTYPYNSNRLAPGVYFFSITSRAGSLNKKVIITK